MSTPDPSANSPGTAPAARRSRLALHWQIVIAIALGIGVGALTNAFAAGATANQVGAVGQGVAEIFLALLKMLVVPLIFASLIAGVVGVPTLAGLRSMSAWTFGYYLSTSLIAIGTGIIFVNLFRPGSGLEYADLVASAQASGAAVPEAATKVGGEGLSVVVDVLQRMIPENIVAAASQNSTILSVIFFAILLGVFIKRTGGEHAEILGKFFSALFEVMMQMTGFVISLAPIGIFGAMVSLAARGGLAIADDLALYMLTVAVALLFHGAITLPVILRVLAKRSPLGFAKAMSPALLTAFSTASSNAALPLTMECAEKRGGVHSEVTSFTLPLGATINMDGTALYEAVAVLFIAQTLGDLTLGQQFIVAFTALAASIGAAGVPHAGLVMMVIVLQAVGLPTDAVMVILAVDRLLDMGRTTINVWSDSCAAAVVDARTKRYASDIS